MRLLLNDYDIEIEIKADTPLCLCIESPAVLRNVMQGLWSQINGENGNIILSDNGKELQICKCSELIINPYAVTPNEKRLLKKLYQEMVMIAEEELYEITSEINSRIISYIDAIIERIPYPVDYETDPDISSLAKAYKVRFDDYGEGAVDKLLSYCKLVHRVIGIECFIFANLKQFMAADELSSFYGELAYEHLYILDIEGLFNYKLKGEECIIIDKDECRINLE